jgi:hypothetical protein
MGYPAGKVIRQPRPAAEISGAGDRAQGKTVRPSGPVTYPVGKMVGEQGKTAGELSLVAGAFDTGGYLGNKNGCGKISARVVFSHTPVYLLAAIYPLPVSIRKRRWG